MPQAWKEGKDFADSGANDLHYVIDSRTGLVQFGPLIRDPGQLQQQTHLRSRTQAMQQVMGDHLLNAGAIADEEIRSKERQYGAVPPRGSIMRMVEYRVGGGSQGNVQKGTITIPKTAVPYVARVTNHIPARNGADGESLQEAAIRVPKILRTRDRAVTKEDFETLAIQAGRGAVARSLCLPANNSAGKVRLLIVPHTNTDAIATAQGISPEQFAISPQLQEQIQDYLDERRLLGVQVHCSEPEYLGVAVQTQVALEPEYNNPRAQQEILLKLRVALYRFFNPLTGGPQGRGWPFGRPVYPSDVVTLFQQTPGVRYLGVVQLFEIRKQQQGWIRTLPQDPIIDPGSLGLICSWADSSLRSGHVVNLLQ